MEKNETLTFRQVADLFRPYSPLLQIDSWIYENFPGDLEYSYISDRLERMGLKQHAVEFLPLQFQPQVSPGNY